MKRLIARAARAGAVFIVAMLLFLASGRADVPPDWRPGQWVYFQDAHNQIRKWCRLNDNSITCCDAEYNSPDKTTPAKSMTDNGCIWAAVGVGVSRPGSFLGGAVLRINATVPTPRMSTPQGLSPTFGYGLDEVRRSGQQSDLVLVNPQGITLGLRFEAGASVAIPYLGWQQDLQERVVRVDAEGWAVTNDDDAAYYDLYPGNGELYRFMAATNAVDYLSLVMHRTAAGREETAVDIGVELIRDPDRVLRQVRSAFSLADIVVADSRRYDINFYLSTDLEAGKSGEGYYTVQPGRTPFAVWRVENPVLHGALPLNTISGTVIRDGIL